MATNRAIGLRFMPFYVRWMRAAGRRVKFQTFAALFLILYIMFVCITVTLMRQNMAPKTPTHMHWIPPRIEPTPGEDKLRVDEHAFKPRQPPMVQPMECYNDERVIHSVAIPNFTTLDQETFFLNAVFDTRVQNETSIRILALRPSGDSSRQRPLYCLVNAVAAGHRLLAIEASVYEFQDNHHKDGLRYGGVLLSCNVQGILLVNPCKVRLSLGKSLQNDTVTLQLLSLTPKQKRDKVAVCVPPIWGVVPMNKLVEFVELTTTLGADHIYFYQFSGDTAEGYTNPNIDHVLRHYKTQDSPRVTAYPWTLPIAMQGNLYYFGQSLAMHHCLYTNIWKYEYIIFNDIDEFLVPKVDSHWVELMGRLDKSSQKMDNTSFITDVEKYSSYCFRAPFFNPEVSESLRTMASLQRTKDMHQTHMKCIVHPERVFEMGIYKVHKAVDEPQRSVEVGTDTALLHHYRPCEQEMPWHIKCSDTIRDDTILKYNAILTERFRTAMKEIAPN